MSGFQCQHRQLIKLRDLTNNANAVALWSCAGCNLRFEPASPAPSTSVLGQDSTVKESLTVGALPAWNTLERADCLWNLAANTPGAQKPRDWPAIAHALGPLIASGWMPMRQGIPDLDGIAWNDEDCTALEEGWSWEPVQLAQIRKQEKQ